MNWTEVTHLRLTGRPMTTLGAERRREALAAVADRDSIFELSWALQHLEPVRQLPIREKGIKADLRYWANDPAHGTTNQDKGWLALGYLV